MCGLDRYLGGILSGLLAGGGRHLLVLLLDRIQKNGKNFQSLG